MPISKQVDVVNETLRSLPVQYPLTGVLCMGGCNEVLRFSPSHVDLETYLQWPHSRNVHSISINWQYFSIVTSVKETFGVLSLSFSCAPGGNHYLHSLFAAALGKGWLQPACSPCCPSHLPSQLFSVKHQSRTALRLGWQEFMCLGIGTDEGGSQCSRTAYAPSMGGSLYFLR